MLLFSKALKIQSNGRSTTYCCLDIMVTPTDTLR